LDFKAVYLKKVDKNKMCRENMIFIRFFNDTTFSDKEINKLYKIVSMLIKHLKHCYIYISYF